MDEKPKLWSNAQAYGLAVICLIVGVVVGYLFHAPATAKVQNTPAITPGAPMDAQKMGEMAAQVTPEQMKSMADKSAQPLLDKLKQNPNDPDLLAQIGAVYGKGQQFDVSAQYYERAVKAKPSAESYTFLASAYHSAGADDKAMESLQHALEIDPKFANALFNLGVLDLRVKGDTKGAIALWEKLVKTHPENPHRAEIEQLIAKVKESAKGVQKQ